MGYEGYARYGVYWCPDTDLAEAGAQWLGWDLYARAKRSVEAPADDMVATPRRYGFHATLKAPFRLAEGHAPGDLDAAVAALAARLRPVVLPGLTIDASLGFLALRPTEQTADLDTLAGACVRELDAHRAPLNEAERARRKASGLDAAALERLDRWGYQSVFEHFRFHLTLSRRLTDAEVSPVLDRAKAHFGRFLGAPVTLGALSLVGDPGEGAPFHHLASHALSG